MKIGTKNFDTDHETYIMGILNVTPDSFSDGGNFNCLDAALRHTEEMLAEERTSLISVENLPDRGMYRSRIRRKLNVWHQSLKQ